MQRLEKTLAALAARRRVGIMAHLVAGYRSLGESREVALALARNGADLLEIQVPFSDPTADGPVITAACQAALAAGATPRRSLELAGEVVEQTGVPVLLMSYYNLLFRWPGGLDAFLEEAAERGVSGLIVPDIPPEESDDDFFERCRAAGLHPTVLVSPNVSSRRLAELRPFASGMIYATARVGTTGAATDVRHGALRAFLDEVRTTFALPVAVGFGIRSRAQVESLAGVAEVAVVGTQLLGALDAGGVEAVRNEVRTLAGA